MLGHSPHRATTVVGAGMGAPPRRPTGAVVGGRGLRPSFPLIGLSCPLHGFFSLPVLLFVEYFCFEKGTHFP